MYGKKLKIRVFKYVVFNLLQFFIYKHTNVWEEIKN